MKKIALIVVALFLVLPVFSQTQEQLKARYSAAEKEIKAAIEQGSITAEQGKKRLAEMKRRMYIQQQERNTLVKQRIEQYLKGGETALKKAVEKGSLSEAAAKEIMADMRKDAQRRIVATTGRTGQTRIRAEMARIEDLVAAGELSEEDGRKKQEALRKRWSSMERQSAAKAEMADYLTAVKKEVDAAVEAGKMTKKEGRKKIAEAEKRVQERLTIIERRKSGESEKSGR